MGRTDAKVVAYNAQALASLTAVAASNNTKLLIDDLYTAVDDKCGKNCMYEMRPHCVRSMHMLTAKALALRFLVADKSCSLQRPKNVHFEPAGCAFMGAQVAKSVQNALLHQAEGLGGTVTKRATLIHSGSTA